MTLLKAYLNSPRARKALAAKPGEEGFSLIELVVVVAVLAILSAIAIPQFASISLKAQASAAANTVATVAKECAVKYANGDNAPLRPTVSPDAYGNVLVTAGTGDTAAHTPATSCTRTGVISVTPDDVSNNRVLPTFSYTVSDGTKTCAPAGLQGCSGGIW